MEKSLLAVLLLDLMMYVLRIFGLLNSGRGSVIRELLSGPKGLDHDDHDDGMDGCGHVWWSQSR
jgi:hypothetical protein